MRIDETITISNTEENEVLISSAFLEVTPPPIPWNLLLFMCKDRNQSARGELNYTIFIVNYFTFYIKLRFGKYCLSRGDLILKGCNLSSVKFDGDEVTSIITFILHITTDNRCFFGDLQ